MIQKTSGRWGSLVETICHYKETAKSTDFVFLCYNYVECKEKDKQRNETSTLLFFSGGGGYSLVWGRAPSVQLFVKQFQDIKFSSMMDMREWLLVKIQPDAPHLLEVFP